LLPNTSIYLKLWYSKLWLCHSICNTAVFKNCVPKQGLSCSQIQGAFSENTIELLFFIRFLNHVIFRIFVDHLNNNSAFIHWEMFKSVTSWYYYQRPAFSWLSCTFVYCNLVTLPFGGYPLLSCETIGILSFRHVCLLLKLKTLAGVCYLYSTPT
jgi:hypothetical protein